VLYGALRRGVGEAGEGLEELREGVRRIVRGGDRETLSDWIACATPDVDHLVQNAMERVFKLLDLPRRSDIEALSANLRRVADAIERWESARRGAAPAPPSAAPPDADAGAP
jgi:hypothetical protein